MAVIMCKLLEKLMNYKKIATLTLVLACLQGLRCFVGWYDYDFEVEYEFFIEPASILFFVFETFPFIIFFMNINSIRLISKKITFIFACVWFWIFINNISVNITLAIDIFCF